MTSMTRNLEDEISGLRVVILAPYRPLNSERRKLWVYAKKVWQKNFPYPVFEGTGPLDGPFNRSAAVNDAALAAGEWDVAIIIDTDVVTNPRAVNCGVHLAASTGYFIVSHTERVMLTEAATLKILRGLKFNWDEPRMAEVVWDDSMSCSVIISRKTWDAVGGFDELFVGWGHEDSAFQMSVETFTGSPTVKLTSKCYHLWHRCGPEILATNPQRMLNIQRMHLYHSMHWRAGVMRTLWVEAAEAKAKRLGGVS